LQWVTGVYAVMFGRLIPAFGAIADRFCRQRIMLIGLVLLGVASLATLSSPGPSTAALTR
jgi:MFS family permease